MENPYLRKAELCDLDAIMEIEGQSFKEEAFSRKQMVYLLKSNNTFLVAEKQHQIAAYLIVLSRKNSLQLRLYALAVSENYRGIGLAKAMLKAAYDLATAGGFTSLSLEVDALNNAAIKLYESFGFKTIKELPAYYKDGSKALKMAMAV